MKKLLFLVTLLAGCQVQPLVKQSPQNFNNEPIAEVKPSAYLKMLDDLKNNPARTDFLALRLAYTDTSAYKPYVSTSMQSIWKQFEDEEYQQCIQQSQAMLEDNYVMLTPHFIAMKCYDALGNSKESSYHQFVFDGLLDSIIDSGDGLSTQSAFRVISLDEIYTIISVMGLKVIDQSLVQANGRAYDQMTVMPLEDGEELELYFDVSIQMSKGLKGLN